MKEDKAKILNALGKIVKNRRKSINISQEELAEQSGLDRTYISGVERGVRNPSLTALLSLSQGMHISVAQLLEDLENNINE